MSSSLQIVLVAILFVWATALTLILAKFYTAYLQISRGSRKENILKLVDEVMARQNKNAASIKELGERVVDLDNKNKFFIQKVGLIRYNPFNDTGGDQSFMLTLLDSQDTGVIISGLHTRSGTRWYAKKIVKGKGLEHELSRDEEKALKAATYLS